MNAPAARSRLKFTFLFLSEFAKVSPLHIRALSQVLPFLPLQLNICSTRFYFLNIEEAAGSAMHAVEDNSGVGIIQ